MHTRDSKQGRWGTTGKVVRLLLIGIGDVAKKLGESLRRFGEMGVEVSAADIRDDPLGREVLPKGTRFYNWAKPREEERLIHEGWQRPFDYAYLANFPAVHIATALRLDFIARKFIFSKPVDSNFDLVQTLHNELQHAGALSQLVQRSCVHDHYRNKPLTTFLRAHMIDLHRRNGFLKRIQVYITEHQTIQDQYWRIASLECGMILDLAPHALSVIYEIVPETLEWTDVQGHTFRRTARRVEIVSCVRARDNSCMLHTLESETFAAIHFRVFEDIEFIPRGRREVANKITGRPFDLLVVVGKGVSIQDRRDHRDLKAIEIEFDGQFVRGNFDTNAISGVIDRELQVRLEEGMDVRHRGLNLPLLQLADHGFCLEKMKNGHLIRPFQSFDQAFSIAALLAKCRAHHTAEDLVRYAPLDKVADVLNRCVAKGLDPMWALDDGLSGLVFGEMPHQPIA
jgi:hypothetical protein